MYKFKASTGPGRLGDLETALAEVPALSTTNTRTCLTAYWSNTLFRRILFLGSGDPSSAHRYSKGKTIPLPKFSVPGIRVELR